MSEFVLRLLLLLLFCVRGSCCSGLCFGGGIPCFLVVQFELQLGDTTGSNSCLSQMQDAGLFGPLQIGANGCRLNANRYQRS